MDSERSAGEYVIEARGVTKDFPGGDGGIMRVLTGV